VPPRLSATERIRAQIDELFASEQGLGEVLEQVARLSVRLVIQAAVEAEVTEFLGRDRYARGDRERAGYRNGHTELTVKTTAGPVVLERPKLRGTSEPFSSRLLGKGVSRTNALEALVLSGFVRGLSVRDVEAALAEALGPEAALSKSTVSRVCEAIKTEFDAWKLRDLGGIELEYLFLDGSHFRMHPGARAEPVLCAWGITTQGTPLLVGLAPGAHEGHDPWASFLGELVERGLRAPLLVAATGMRRGELAGLRWVDVDLEAARVSPRRPRVVVNYTVEVSEPKTAKGRRSLALDAVTVAALHEQEERQAEERALVGPGWQDSGLVFTRPDGAPIHPDLLSDWFERLAREARLPKIRLHDVRHSYASAALAAGIPAKIVSERLGGPCPHPDHAGYLLACPAWPGRSGGRDGGPPDPRRRAGVE